MSREARSHDQPCSGSGPDPVIYSIQVPRVGSPDDKLSVLVDPEIFAAYAGSAWHLNPKNYAQRTANALERLCGLRGTVLLHRLVVGAKRGEIVDHINGNPLDCRRSNLSKCDLFENGMNRGHLNRNNTSGERGVYRQNGGWVVGLRCKGVRHYRGTFTSFREAVLVKRALEASLYGEFGSARHLGHSAAVA